MLSNESPGHFAKINRARVSDNTISYIKEYLNPDKKWDDKTDPRKRIHLIRSASVNGEVIANYIRKMEYRDFLRTLYWKVISAHVKYKAGYKCQVCNSKASLDTHHRNYEIHGYEHARINELIALCKDCHQRHHNRQNNSHNKNNPHLKDYRYINDVHPSESNLKIVQLLLILAIICLSVFWINSSITKWSCDISEAKNNLPITESKPERRSRYQFRINRLNAPAEKTSTLRCDTRRDSRDNF